MSTLLRGGRTTENVTTGSKLPKAMSKQASAFAYSSTTSAKILERHGSTRTTAVSNRKVSPGTENNRGVVIERTSSYETMGFKTPARGKENGGRTPIARNRKMKAIYSQTRINAGRKENSGSPKLRARPQSSGVHLSKHRTLAMNRANASNNQLLFNTKIMSKANYNSSTTFMKIDGDPGYESATKRPKSSVPGIKQQSRPKNRPQSQIKTAVGR